MDHFAMFLGVMIIQLRDKSVILPDVFYFQ